MNAMHIVDNTLLSNHPPHASTTRPPSHARYHLRAMQHGCAGPKNATYGFDIASSGAGEKLPGRGQPGSAESGPATRQARGLPPVDRQVYAHPDDQYAGIANLDRVQDALRTYDDIKVAADRVVAIVPDGAGGTVTYLHGHAEGGEMYHVHYDVFVTALGNTQAAKGGGGVAGGAPTVKGMIGDIKMQPQRGTDAPVLEDAHGGRIRVMGIAAAEDVNVVMTPEEGPNRRAEKKQALEMKDRRERVAKKLSADSPNANVMEGAGQAARRANQPSTTEVEP